MVSQKSPGGRGRRDRFVREENQNLMAARAKQKSSLHRIPKRRAITTTEDGRRKDGTPGISTRRPAIIRPNRATKTEREEEKKKKKRDN